MFLKSTPACRGNLLIRSPPLFGFYPVTESVVLPPEARWNAMTDYPAAILLSAIQKLRCPKCRARMRLARTSPGPTGFNLRTFDCSECDHAEQIAIPNDPMKSDAVGWFTGDLRSPK
jgi:hypothetical protein